MIDEITTSLPFGIVVFATLCLLAGGLGFVQWLGIVLLLAIALYLHLDGGA
jgi:hypothetical protein